MRICVLLALIFINLTPSFSQNSPQYSSFNTDLILGSFPEKSSPLKDTALENLVIVQSETHTEMLTGMTNLASTVDSIPWNKIDLSSPRMKKKSAKPFPWWIVATTAGAAAITTGVILLTKEDMPADSSAPVARNDQFSIPCKMNLAISPLGNDTGTGLRISSITGAPAGWVTFTDQHINILEAATQNFSFNYTIIDATGAIASASISIVFEFTPIQLQNQTFQSGPGDLVTHQIFTNAICTGCTVSAVNAMPFSNFTWTPEGLFSFQVPNQSQAQTYLFTFLVTDRCMQTSTAVISVIVRPDCDIEPSFIVKNEECDFGSGSIETIINPATNFKFEWSNGVNTAINNGLSAGKYSLTISLISDTTCFDIFEIEILSEVPEIDLMNDTYQTVSNTLFTGNVLNNDDGSMLRVTQFEDLDVLEFDIQSDGSFRFLADENAEDQYTTVYTVTDKCGNTSTASVVFQVAKLPCDFNAIINTTPAACGKSNGTAAVSINPVGATYLIKWPNGATGPTATGFAPGTYVLIIEDSENGCVLSFGFTITESSASNFIQFIETTPATCIGGASVELVLNDPLGSGMQVAVTQGNLTILSVNVSSGPINLGEIANFLPGNYRITVSCQGCPARCAQIVDITIAQVPLLLEINEDADNIPSNSVWNGNVLTNDIGVGMQVVGFTQPSDGMVNVDSDGSATYTPPSDFSGSIMFTYTVRDTCGQEKNAKVTINVEALPCDFIVQFSNVAADCGMSNGSSSLMITPPGNYEVNWSDGSTGISNSMLSANNYTVTISIPNTGCSQEFSTVIEELPPLELIRKINTNPATCLGGGSMGFTLSNPGPDDIVVDIYLDNQYILSASIPSSGTFSAEIDSLPAGLYLLQALESGSLRRCADTETFEIGLMNLDMEVMNDNYTIGFNTAWTGNVLLNDMGTGLEVNAFTQTPNGVVQILSNGNGTFIPNPGFTGTATFQYFAIDSCNQEQMATVSIFVLPFGEDFSGTHINDTKEDIHSVEFFQYSNGFVNSLFLPAIPEGFSSHFSILSPGLQNGFRYSMHMKDWLFQTEFSYGESGATNDQNQTLYQNNFRARIGVAWNYSFNGNKIIVESGAEAITLRSVFSNGMNAILSGKTLHALYLKTEYQIKLKSGYCLFWEPHFCYFPAYKQLSGMLITGCKFNIE